MSESIKVPIKIHPRAFSAFGEDLITNENIAMIELVKNSYDAYALKVEIEFGFDKRGIPFISITDASDRRFCRKGRCIDPVWRQYRKLAGKAGASG